MHCYEWVEARGELERAIELNPNYAHARQLHAFYLAFNGRIEEAGAEMNRALRLDPLSLPINTDVGAIHYFANGDKSVPKEYLEVYGAGKLANVLTLRI